jgi:hypothetical protein
LHWQLYRKSVVLQAMAWNVSLNLGDFGVVGEFAGLGAVAFVLC